MGLEERGGGVKGEELLQGTRAATGKQLRGKGWTCPILPGKQIEAYGQNLAATLAKKSQNALRLLKQHLVRNLVDLVEELKQVEAEVAATEHSSQTVATEQISSAEHIHVETPTENVVLINWGGSQRQV